MRAIKYVIDFFKRKRFIKKQVQLLNNYVSNGKFKYNNNCFYIVLNDNKEIERAISLLDEKLEEKRTGIIETIKKLLSNGKVKINGENKKFNATLILLTHQSKSLKMFDFKESVVITKYLKENEYFKTIENYNYFKYYFKTPKLVEQNDDENVIIEEFINYIPTSTLNIDQKKFLINDIFNRYINYLKYNKNSITLKNEYPYIKSLGDLMYKNIFYKDGEFYYIDFELSNTNFILYDIFTFIFYAFYNNNETHYYKQYISGSYDNYINQMFKISGIKYEVEKKDEYFNIFIKERIKEEKKFSLDNVELTLLDKYNELKDKE